MVRPTEEVMNDIIVRIVCYDADWAEMAPHNLWLNYHLAVQWLRNWTYARTCWMDGKWTPSMMDVGHIAAVGIEVAHE